MYVRSCDSHGLVFIVFHLYKGKFKGYNKSNIALSVDDLVDLLKSVDHDKIVKSNEIISDFALEALLDRNFTHQKRPNVKDDTKHDDIFKVVEEQNGSSNCVRWMDEKGKIGHEDDIGTENIIPMGSESDPNFWNGSD